MYVLARNQKEFLGNFSKNLNNLLYHPTVNKQDILEQRLLFNLESHENFEEKSGSLSSLFLSIQEIIFFLVTAMFTGAESWEALVNFGDKNLRILQQYLPFVVGVNYVNIYNICNLLRLIDHKEFDMFIRNSIEMLIPTIKNYYNYKKLDFRDHKMINFIHNGNIYNNLDRNSDFQQKDLIAKNMLTIRQISIEIIKKYKVNRSSKLGLNVIRRMSAYNQYLLNQIIKDWIL